MMQEARGEAHKRRREQKTGQKELFGGTVAHDPSYFCELRGRYTTQAKESVLKLLQTKRRVSYDDAWALALKFPLSWEVDLKQWIREWKQKGYLEITGMRANQHVPQRGQNILLVWAG